MNAKFLRRLTPLMAAFVVACNINESSNEQAALPAPSAQAVAFAPRIVAAGGKLPQSDSVFLALSTRAKASDPWKLFKTFSKSWQDSGVKVEGLTIGLQWKAEVAGVNNGGDTLWKGTDTGSIASAAAVSRNLADTAGQLLHVRQLAAKPSLANIATTLAVGTVISLPEGRIAHTWGKGSAPDCSKDSITAMVTPDAGHTILNLRSCGDSTTWPSGVVTRTFDLLSSRLVLADPLLRSGNTTIPLYSWDSSVTTTSAFSGDSISWILKLGTQTLSDTSKSIRIPKDWIKALPAKGDTFVATALVTVNSGSNGKTETDSLRWIVRVPETRIPQVSPAFNTRYDSLTLNWNTTDSSVLTLIAPSSTINSFAPGAARPTLKVHPRDIVSGSVVAFSSTTGRPSDMGKFSFTVPGLAEIVPSDTVRFDSTLRFSTVGSSDGMTINVCAQVALGKPDSGSVRSSCTIADTLNVAHQALVATAPSSITGHALAFVRLYRGQLVIDSQWLSWTVRMPTIPLPSMRLDSTGRSDTTLLLRWASEDSVRITRNGAIAAILGPKDSLWIQLLQPNQSCTVSVVTLDSKLHRESLPVPFMASTRNPPRKPKFSAGNTNTTYGEVTVELSDNDLRDNGTSWLVGTHLAGGTTWDYSPMDSTTLIWKRTLNVGGDYDIRVRALRDGDTVNSDDVTLTVLRTAGVAPQMPVTTLQRGLDSLSWSWVASANRSYKACWIAGAVSNLDTTSKNSTCNTLTSTANSHFTLTKLPQGSTYSVVFYVWSNQGSNGDSAGGVGASAVQSATTKVAPTASNVVKDLKASQDGKSITWSWTSTMTSVYSVNGTVTTASMSSGSYYAQTPIANGIYDYTLGVRVMNADSVVSTDSVSIAIHIPKRQSALDVSTFPSHMANTVWKFKDQSTWTSGAPDALRITAPDGTKHILTFQQAQAGSQVDLLSSSESQSLGLQWTWKNGDTSVPVTVTRTVPRPSLKGSFFMASGTVRDTLFDATATWTNYSNWGPASVSCLLDGATDWTLCDSSRAYTAGGSLALSEGTYPRGTDSIRILLTANTDSSWVTATVARTRSETVTYRDGTYGTIQIARLSGVTWMAQNLNWDPKDQGYGICLNNSNDADTCAKFGRYYTLSQAWWLLPNSNSTVPNHVCDTTAYPGSTNSGCVLSGTQGICPIGWHIPSDAEYNDLMVFGLNALLSKNDPLITGTTPSNSTGMSMLTTDAAYQQTDAKTWKYLRGTSSTQRALYWGQNPSSSNLVYGGVFQVNYHSNGGTPGLYAYIPASAAGALRQPEAYPVRCVKD